MVFPPTYRRTDTISKLVYDLDVLRAAYRMVRPAQAEIADRHQLVIKQQAMSSLQIAKRSGESEALDQQRLFEAYRWVYTDTDVALTPEMIRHFHAMIVPEDDRRAGKIRENETSVRDAQDTVLFTPAAPYQITLFLLHLCHWHENTEAPASLSAAFIHAWLVRILPFESANGRVARLLCLWILVRGGYGFDGIVAFDRFLLENRDDYYRILGNDEQDVTEFVEWYLGVLVGAVKETIVPNVQDTPPGLLPRRQEILSVIRDHHIVTFDFLARRFRGVPRRTLHHDLSRLVNGGYVHKLGKTRGARYTTQQSDR